MERGDERDALTHNREGGGNAHQQEIQTPTQQAHHLWNHQTAPPATSYYDSVGTRSQSSNVNHPMVPIPQSGPVVKHVTFDTTPQSLSSNQQNVSPQPPFMQHMMLGGAYGNYSAQQNPIQSVNVYQQDYAQKCYEEKI